MVLVLTESCRVAPFLCPFVAGVIVEEVEQGACLPQELLDPLRIKVALHATMYQLVALTDSPLEFSKDGLAGSYNPSSDPAPCR